MGRELEIIKRKLRSGDEKFYESLFHNYYAPLTYYANKYINDVEVAQEIVQDMFVKLFEKRYALNINTSFKSYLYKSVHNSCLNYINQQNIREHHHQQIKESNDADANITEEEIQTIELEQTIYQEIEKLPAQCKRIFKMNRFEGLSNGDIAEQLQLSKRTVETQISKALKILRNKLAKYIPLFLLIILAIKIISFKLVYVN